MPRPTWSGFIRLSLVTVPVQAFPAEASEQRDFSFHQLHKKCHSRIRYKKVCPVHGEVPNDEIISAYEYEKGKYVEMDDVKKKEGETKSDKSIDIENFVPLASIDPLLFEGSSYYLLPDGDAGSKSYALLCKAMQDEDHCAVAEAVLWRRNRLLLIRPQGHLLTMSVLRYPKQLRTPEDFQDDAPSAHANAQELRLAKRLVGELSVDDVDWSKYEDTERKKISKAIETKVADEEVIESEADDDEAPIINLMDALKKSVAKSGKRAPAARSSKRPATVRLPHAASHHRKPKPKAKKRKVS
ncbi:MAG: Ku protein [Pirellula sp.]|nr:Ku protein [Pirellula sp.]